MRMRTLRLAGSRVQFVGTRAAVLLVFGDASLDGAVIDVGARNGQAGPGGSARDGQLGHCDGHGGDDADNNSVGGGGGGWLTNGGNGGIRGGSSAFADNGGALAFGIDLRNDPLVGGCHGGVGGNGFEAVNGGAGGGALQLAVAGVLDLVGAVLLAGGGGGRGSATEGGSGGGSGGSLLVEAHALQNENDARFGVRGGGGGGGGAVTAAGADGFDGEATQDPLRAGDGGAASPGGDGGDCCDDNGNGFDGDDGNNIAGAGGGGAGGLGVFELHDDL
jgi:hypothetical protein